MTTALSVLLVILFSFPLAARAQEAAPVLRPEPERITDSAIAADREQLARAQARLAALNRAGSEVGAYHFAKAQAWLDLAADSYNENDRSSVPEEALLQALWLIGRMERQLPPGEIGWETAMIGGSIRVREDLWALAEGLKSDGEAFPCVEGLVARLEVQLVWAGIEQRELGWRHSAPYLQAAERLARATREQAAACAPPAADICPPARVEAPPTLAPTASEPLPDRIHFAYDSAMISPASAAILDRVAAAMQSDPSLRVVLYGHADQRGSLAYNLDLSRQRAERVGGYLLARGITAERIALSPRGKEQPAVEGSSLDDYARNRRVEFFFTVGPAPPVLPQQGDLQPEQK